MSYIQTRITDLEAGQVRYEAERTRIVSEANPEADPRERWIWEENRRSGLLAIDQSLAGIAEQLQIYRSM